MGTILCFTLRGQSYISKVPDPEKAFNMLFLGRVQVHGKKGRVRSVPGRHAHPWCTLYKPLRGNNIEQECYKVNVGVCAPTVQKLPKQLIFSRGAKDTAPYLGQQLCIVASSPLHS